MKLRPKRRLKLANRERCMEACLGELEFECRSANWYSELSECQLSDQDRHSVSQSEASGQQLKTALRDLYGPAASSNQTSQPADTFAVEPQSYRQSAEAGGSSVESSSRTAQAANDGSPSSKLASSWTSSKRHLKQLLFGRPAQARRARQASADWSATSAPSLFEGHYIDVPASTQVDYLENNCVFEPNKLCEFRKIQNRVLKTVDSIYQDIGSLEECKQKCLNAPYRCYSFDYGDTSERVCRTSHLDQASLMAINEPYLEVTGAITYELATCFNVSIQCRAREILVQVSSSKSFSGKIYAKSRPDTCVTDVSQATHFELAMKYHNQEGACDVRASSSQSQGVFSNEIVIQHHDRIMTTQDVGLSVFCQYDLGNRSVTNNIDLAIEPLDEGPAGEGKQAGAGSHSANKSPLTITGLATTVVRSPNVTMRITNMNGQPVSSATVGDRLALLFEVEEKTSKCCPAPSPFIGSSVRLPALPRLDLSSAGLSGRAAR